MELYRDRLHPNAAFLFCILVDSYDIPGCYMIICPFSYELAGIFYSVPSLPFTNL
jgi:hypothetical protein